MEFSIQKRMKSLSGDCRLDCMNSLAMAAEVIRFARFTGHDLAWLAVKYQRRGGKSCPHVPLNLADSTSSLT